MRNLLRLRWLPGARPASGPPDGAGFPVGASRPGSVAAETPRPSAQDELEAIVASGLFNAAYYSARAGADGGLRTLIRHYLDRPLKSRISPSPRFDPAFYLSAYPDVAAAGVDPFLHYVLYGLSEHRYTSLRSAEDDVRAIRATGEFNEAYYRQRRGVQKYADPVLDYLIYGATLDVRPNERFDQHFVYAYYDVLRRGYSSLFAFYCRNRRRPWCHAGWHGLHDITTTIDGSGLFDRAFYKEKYLGKQSDLDELAHYSTEGFMLGFDPSEAFSNDYYLRNYADIARAEMNPLFHYERHGKKEGRKSSASSAVSVESGARQPSDGRPWVLIVSHEASLTGAPIVGLSVAERMSAYANVVTWIGRDGPLAERYRNASVSIVTGFGGEADRHLVVAKLVESQPIEFAIVNSIVSRSVMPALIDAGAPIVSLVHEFAEYAKPAGWVSNVVLNSTQAVVPARVVRASLITELQDLRVPDQPSGVIVRSQGRCQIRASDDASSLSADQILTRLGVADPESRPRIVLGCGAVQIRKGVDIFVETARLVKAASPDKVLFVWVGGGYKPKEDMSYSVYIADQVERSGLAETVHFFGEQPDLDPFWRLADVFYLPSRLDPFPNVALDAIVEGLALVCFKDASGIAELVERVPDSVFTVPYHDTKAAAEKLIALSAAARERRRTIPARLPELAAEFSVADYADALFEIGREARRKQDILAAEAIELHSEGFFDARFFHNGLQSWAEPSNPLPYRRAGDLARLYLQFAAHGVEVARPFPGSTSRPRLVGAEPIAREVHSGDVAFLTPRVASSEKGRSDHDLVLHVHVGAAPDKVLMEALAGCASGCTVLLTTDLPDVARSLAASDHGEASIRTIVDPDLSDPLVSFLKVIQSETPPSSLIGHLWLPHPDDAKGFRRDRITRALEYYGSRERRRQALDLFDADPSLGLVFPEHAAVRGSPRAQAVADALAGSADLPLSARAERWPLDLVFWIHLDRVRALRAGEVLRESRRQALTSSLQDRLDGFGLFLTRLCVAEGAKSLAAHDPGEDAADERPLIYPN